MNNNRRSFIRNAGIAVTAAVAGNGAVAETGDAGLQHKLAVLEDSNAIRALQQRYFALAQQGTRAELTTLFADNVIDAHSARLLDARVDADSIDVAADRLSATAQVRARVLLGTALRGEGTLQQMARLQGQTERQWSETGTYTARYVKQGAEWKISALEFRKA